MAIYAPGKRDPKRKRKLQGGRRSATASLSLTSMVDMFTILVVFLLMNFSSTGEIIYIPKDVKLPKASETKELKPAHVVSVTTDSITLERETVAKLDDVKNMPKGDWLIPKLRDRLAQAFKDDETKELKDSKRIRNNLPGAAKPKEKSDEEKMRK